MAWPVRIQSWNLDKDVKTLNSLNVSIDYVNRMNGVIIAYVRDANEQDKIQAAGFITEQMPDLAKEYALQLWEETKDTRDPMRAYYTLTEYQLFMQQTAAQYPNICQLVQYGSSGQDRPLYMMKISDNVTIEENEPELKYVGSIHGDEVVGYDMLIRLIGLLTSQYGSNTRITNIVDNTEIWINPMMNPDGNALVQRYNAAGIDLNRNFPMPTGAQHPDGNVWGVENVAMMDFSLARDFDLSLNFHGGALVINYPWDYTYTLAPDDALLHEMALTYSRENAPMYASPEFPQGVTNGAAWYVITGSMQDWNYGYTDCIEMTAEISNIKWPAASTLDTYWAQNQESLLKYLEFAQKGVRGVVTNSSGTPLTATLTVAGNVKTEKTDMPNGDYHRLLLPGTYLLTAAADGYLPQTVSITVPEGVGITQNFILEQAQLTTFRGQVRNLAGQPIANALVNLFSYPTGYALTDAQGLFQISNVYEGLSEIQIEAPGYAQYSNYLSISQSDFRNVFIMRAPLFTDDFESGMGNWTVTGNWGIVNADGSNVLTDSPAGNYSNNQNRNAKLTNPVSLLGVSNPGLSFRCKYALESGYDFVYMEASSNGTSWTQLGSFSGTQSTWTNQVFSLSSYAGGNCYIRFRISTDSGQTADGIYIDDVQVFGNSSSIACYGDVNSDGIVNKADIDAINKYSIGLDPLPNLDPRPWEAFRINNADVDNDETIDAFDAYLLCKYISEALYLLPAQSGEPEPVSDPGMTASYNGTLNFSFTNINLLKSITFSTFPDDLLSVYHQGFPMDHPYVQAFNNDNDSYAFAGYDIQQSSLYATLGANPQNFTLYYTINGVAGSQFVDTSSAAEDEVVPGLVTALLPNTPNPFNPDTTIHFLLAKPNQTVKLNVYNLKGQLVRSLINAELASGKHSIVWDGKDTAGNAVSSGVYLYRLQTPDYNNTRKMLLSK